MATFQPRGFFSSPRFFRVSDLPASPIASTSHHGVAEDQHPTQIANTSHRGDAEDQHPTQTEVRQECESPSDSFSCHQVFLSHSGHQKSFVERLFLDLQRENISCFFDRDPQALPKGEDFPPLIFQAAQKCRVGVVVLSDEFISSKWPMLELCEFIRAQKSTNPKLKILPLFFRLSPQSLCQKLQQKDSLKRSWQELLKDQKRTINLEEWVDALAALRSINGEVYDQQESEEHYRAKIVRSVHNILPPKLPYDESYVEGRERLKQEVARLFSDTPWAEDNVKMAGVYGVAGMGKTTFARLACNLYAEDFDGRVLQVELGKGMPLERLKRALKILTHALEVRVNFITDIEEGWCVFNQMMKVSEGVFLAIDNISDESIDEARRFLRAVRSARKQSIILLTARSSLILRRLIRKGEGQCMPVPSLTLEEAVPILLQPASLAVCNLSTEKRDIAERCAMECFFSWHDKEDKWSCRAFHPLALRAFGAFLYDSCDDLSEWINILHSGEPRRSSLENLFGIFEESFQRLSEEHKKIFMLMCLYLPESYMASHDVFNWLALACDTNVEHIKRAMVELKRKGFVENMMESNDRPYIHDLHLEFAANKADGTGEWISLKDRLGIPVCLQKTDGIPFLAMKFDQCHFPCWGFVNEQLFRNVLVLHLQDRAQYTLVNLSAIRIVRSITIIGCAGLQVISGLECLTSLVYLVIKGCHANLQFSGMEGLVALQHLEVDAIPLETIREPSRQTLSFSSAQNPRFVEHVQKSSGQLDLSACANLRTLKLTNLQKWTEICLFSLKLAGPVFSNLTGPVFSNLSELCLVKLHGLQELPSLVGLITLQRLTLEGMHNLKELPTLTCLTSLKWLQLEGMHKLKELPTFSGLTSLQLLRLKEMHSLKELPTLTGLTSLGCLQLEGMHRLKELPTLSGLASFQWLWLKEMHSLKELPTLTGLTSLKWLQLEGMHKLKELPAFSGLTSLQLLRLKEMHSLKELPTLTGLTSLGCLHLQGVHRLKELPTLSGLTSLQWLRLEKMHSLKKLPTLTGLTSLEWLHLEEMHRLKELPTLTGLTSLQELDLWGTHSLKELPTLTELTSLRELRLREMHSLKELPTLTGLTSLQILDLRQMYSLKELPTLTGLISLQKLDLWGTHSLKELPTIAELTSLRELRLREMHSLKELPTLTGLISLQELRLEEMHSLEELPTLTGLTSIRELWLREMHSLEELPTLTGLISVSSLGLRGMHRLKDIPTFGRLPKLYLLSLREMHNLKELPTLAGLTGLRWLTLEEMHNLRELPTLPGKTDLCVRLKGMHSLKEFRRY